MKRIRFIIVGVGKIGAGLLQKLSKDYELLCIDNAPGMDEQVRKLRGETTTVMQGDATSRLVLEEVGVNDAECVIVTTTSEPVNIEVCRILKEHFRPKRVIAVGNGNNDWRMLKAARLGIAVSTGEGCAVATMLHADIQAGGILEALDLLLHPQRLRATLRT